VTARYSEFNDRRALLSEILRDVNTAQHSISIIGSLHSSKALAGTKITAIIDSPVFAKESFPHLPFELGNQVHILAIADWEKTIDKLTTLILTSQGENVEARMCPVFEFGLKHYFCVAREEMILHSM
jgi:hypothetical protein